MRESPLRMTLVLSLLFAGQALAQANKVSGAAMDARAASSGASAPDPTPAPVPAPAPASADPEALQVIVYPIFGFAPLFSGGASYPTIDFPNLPSGGGGVNGGIASGDTSTSLNGAAFAGFRLEKSKWAVQAAFEYAGLGATRSSPLLDIGMDFTYGQLLVARKILPNFYVDAGFRRIGAKLDVNLLTLPTLTAKPTLWDPLIGVTYRKPLGRKWILNAHMDGGGFGVGADQDISGLLSAECRFKKHFGFTVGAEALHLAISPQIRNRTLDLSTNLWGPVFGLGIYFGR
jgi:hypothetical protein